MVVKACREGDSGEKAVGEGVIADGCDAGREVTDSGCNSRERPASDAFDVIGDDHVPKG